MRLAQSLRKMQANGRRAAQALPRSWNRRSSRRRLLWSAGLLLGLCLLAVLAWGLCGRRQEG